ncbi:nucleolar protein 12-domain-containing protein [Paraphysoderma sedebokerense]|nr:nucleolar protein 12-domain-containing protein [Paraphysoderma sedebokerense]
MDNWSLLTKGSQIYAQKRQKKQEKSEIKFDEDARKEFLTGFRKRKQERKRKAQEFVKQQERLERNERRRMKREAVAEMARKMQRKMEGLDSDGFDSDEDAKYMDDVDQVAFSEKDTLTTVTTITDMDLNDDGFANVWNEESNEQGPKDVSKSAIKKVETQTAKVDSVEEEIENLLKSSRKSEKTAGKKKFRYESKRERKLTASKQKMKKIKQGSRTGNGKFSKPKRR